MVFPEGTRVAPGERRPYQLGGAWLAARERRADRAGRAQRRPGLAAQRFHQASGHRDRPHRSADRPRGPRSQSINAIAEKWIEEQQKALTLIELRRALHRLPFRPAPPPHARHHRRRQAGFRVAAPLRAPWREVEAFLREKERWILRKLDEWARLPRARGACAERAASRCRSSARSHARGADGSRRAVHHQRRAADRVRAAAQRAAKR